MASGIIVTNGCLQDKFSVEDPLRGGKKFIPATQDGVFSNLMAKPEVIRIDQLEQDVVDKPPVIFTHHEHTNIVDIFSSGPE